MIKEEQPTKKAGRPRKFDENTLLEGVKNYVRKNNDHPTLIKPTKVAQYFKTLGLNVNYQDLSRYKKVDEFIKTYNEHYMKMIFGGGEISIYTEDDLPIYEKIDVKTLLKNNKTTKEIEETIRLLNISNEKLVESHGKMQNKLVLEAEKIILQDKEIEELKMEIDKIRKGYEEEIKSIKNMLKISKENQKLMGKKMAFYEYFISKYHYDSMAEYALYLENIIKDKVEIEEGLIDAEKYKNGTLNLSDIIKKYQNVLLTVDNTLYNYIGDDLDNTNSNLLKNDIINTEDIMVKNKDMDIKDMEDSLAKLFRDL